ncbi:hypothetical protein EUX98_g1649 [Antrodiella citrinella]|uniref:Uncharacterized protein n=1 Tax=Antrodiella citrinella TaxID=2447956 RepID=A0A4S4N101_9APHY|nr:hypothetical protein EUX98_g1649 [Antrodiella citrinella]
MQRPSVPLPQPQSQLMPNLAAPPPTASALQSSPLAILTRRIDAARKALIEHIDKHGCLSDVDLELKVLNLSSRVKTRDNVLSGGGLPSTVACAEEAVRDAERSLVEHVRDNVDTKTMTSLDVVLDAKGEDLRNRFKLLDRHSRPATTHA